MPNLLKVVNRGREIATERLARTLQDLRQQQQDANDAPQREKRAAYEMIRQMPADQYAMARQQFDQQYGDGEYARQQGLGVTRQQKAEVAQ